MRSSFVRFLGWMSFFAISLGGLWLLSRKTPDDTVREQEMESQLHPAEQAGAPDSIQWLESNVKPVPLPAQYLRLKREHLSWTLMDADTGKVLESHEPQRPVPPASVTKLLTGIAALEVLGPEFVFETHLSYQGVIRDGILDGDLYLEGGGDPFLTASDLMNLALSLKRLKIRAVSGRLVGFSRGFQEAASIAPAALLAESYNAGVSLLSVEFNQTELHWNDAGFYRMPPGLPIPLELRAGPFRSESGLDYDSVSRAFLFPRSKRARPGRVRLPVNQPTLQTISTFRKMAEQTGVRLPEPEVDFGVPPLGRKLFRTHTSLPVARLTEMMMEYSNNVFAELLMVGVARKLIGGTSPRDLNHAAQVVERWLLDRYGSAHSPGELKYFRGSGLTAQNRISPRILARALLDASRKHFSGRTFASLLPISGWKGTLARRLDGPGMGFRIFAKTGTLQYASSIAGYLFDHSGRERIFVLMASDPKRMASLDASQGEGGEWRGEARAWQNASLERWSTTLWK